MFQEINLCNLCALKKFLCGVRRKFVFRIFSRDEMKLPVALHDASFEDVILALVPSWVEKGTQLPESFQYKNRNTFRENYINPLKRLGFIVATNPETPNAPDNKYVLTDLGCVFLMGR